MGGLSFRKWVEKLRANGKLTEAKRPLSSQLEAAAFIKALEPKPTLLRVGGCEIPVAANVCASRSLIAEYLNIQPSQIVSKLLAAIEHPTKPQRADNPPCFEVSEKQVDLNRLPLLLHAEKDGGKYISSAVVVARHPELGQNVSFHRLMQIGKDELAIRIVPRHLHTFLEKSKGDLPIAICIGNAPNVLLAGACSVELGRDELEIANSLEPLKVTKCAEADCYVPAETEFVLVGRITGKVHEEGPFIDLTETYDLVRPQHVVKIDRLYHRERPIYHALIPGGLEHKMLMGTPREPTIYREVSKVCDCADVFITPGGASWLHAIVKIRKRREDDGRKAIEAAFRGHTSLKHVLIVDEDIDLTDPMDVEWAFATRFQADRGLVIKAGETGSSLDPSADPETRKTTKVGFDATKPLEVKGKNFEKAKFPEVDWRKFT
jgi:anhydromevalonate phosphate decarboxylase